MGIYVNVYRNPDFGDCTNGGISSVHNRLCVVNVSGPFEPNDDYPAFMLHSHCKGCVRLVPAVWHEEKQQWQIDNSKWYMMGGNYAGTSDSRLSDRIESLTGIRFYGAVAIHDRTE